MDEKNVHSIITNYLIKNPRVFKIPIYVKWHKKILYCILLCLKKLRYKKLYYDDYENLGEYIRPDKVKNISEVNEIFELKEFDNVWLVGIVTKMEKELGEKRYNQLGGEGPILVDKNTGDLYYTYSFAAPETFVDWFNEYKISGKDINKIWKKLN